MGRCRTGPGRLVPVRRRYVCVALELGGQSPYASIGPRWPLVPECGPIGFSIDIVGEDGVARHAYDSLIRPVNAAHGEPGKELADVIAAWKALMRPSDVIVMHQASQVMSTLRKAAKVSGIEQELRFLDATSVLCTMTCPYSIVAACRSGRPALDLTELCEHFGVETAPPLDAPAASTALGACVVRAWSLGVMIHDLPATWSPR